jgi:hypothetical protein
MNSIGCRTHVLWWRSWDEYLPTKAASNCVLICVVPAYDPTIRVSSNPQFYFDSSSSFPCANVLPPPKASLCRSPRWAPPCFLASIHPYTLVILHPRYDPAKISPHNRKCDPDRDPDTAPKANSRNYTHRSRAAVG